jgi:lon-related putative ATP-dependent protease
MTGDGSQAVPVEALSWRCDPADLGFATTAELPDIEDFVGQARATEALRYGVRVRDPACHVFVMGAPGSGRHALARQMLAAEAPRDRASSDWCYVNHFADPRRPRIVQLPAGRGAELRQDMLDLVADLDAALPAAFEADAYREQRARLDAEFEATVAASFERVKAEAGSAGVAIVETPQGVGVAPVRDGSVLSPEDFAALPEAERRRITGSIDRVGELLRAHVEQVPRWQRQRRQGIRELDRRTAGGAVRSVIEELKAKYATHTVVSQYLREAEDDLIDNARQFRRRETPPPLAFLDPEAGRDERKSRYAVNLLVESRDDRRAPIVYESNPTYQNLIGVIENVAQFGTLSTDFTMLRAGALHRANGGYLIIDAERLLAQPYAWEALKRALFAREVRIESLAQQLSLMTTVTLSPEPVPLDVRVVLVGSRLAYYLLNEFDPDFAELFKVPVDVEDDVDRTPDSLPAYARLLATLARQQGMRPFGSAAIARIIDHAARLSGDARKLSTRVRTLRDLLRESDYCAMQASRDVVAAGDVEQAIAQRERRLERLKLRMQEDIRRGHRHIETDGKTVGQVNGLSVIDPGGQAFAVPTRISATARIGDGEIIDIEREVELGGAIHSKGVLILSSFLAARYAAEQPLSLQASVVFEQSYGGVEGDSASLAELCALLSAVGDLPLSQAIAVTGSVDQQGRLQVVGGINEKIEGFFDLCAERGLTGEQGVIIPARNVQHLMLAKRVVDAVASGRFRVFALRSIDEAMQLLSGLHCGERQPDGSFPGGSVNALIETRLQHFAQRRQAFRAPES